MKSNIYLCMAFICCITMDAYGQSYDHTADLTEDVLIGYSSHVIPLIDQSNVMFVNISTMLFSILDVDLVQGMISLLVRVDTTWYDEKIKWIPSHYGDIQSMKLNQELVWTPSIVLGNPKEFTKLGQPWMNVKYMSNGSAFYTTVDAIDSACTFQTRFWPFDKQICNIIFTANNYRVTRINLNVPSVRAMRMDYCSPNIEWSLVDTDAYSRERSQMSEAVFRIKLKRKYVFYMLSTILPLVLILTLFPLVFRLPSNAGERVSFSITIMLSVVVFLMVIGKNMPKQSDPIPMVCVYVLAGTVMGVITTTAVILNLAVYHRSGDVPIGPWYRSITQILTYCTTQRKTTNRIEPISINVQDINKTKSDGHTSYNATDESTDTIEGLNQPSDVTGEVKDAGEVADTDITWHDVSAAIDTLLFQTMTFLIVVPTVTFFLYLVLASDYNEDNL